MKKPAIPAVPTMGDEALRKLLIAVKENLEIIEGRGRTGGRLPELPATATLADMIAAYNLMRLLLQE